MSWSRSWAQLASHQWAGSCSPETGIKHSQAPVLLSTPLGWSFLIPLGLWIHRNERLRRRWASSFLLFPRNKVEEAKKCCKHKKLWVEQLPCSGGAETNLWLHLKRKKEKKKAAEPTWRRWNLCSLSRFWHHHELSSTGFSLWHCQTAVSWEQPFPSTRKSR